MQVAEEMKNETMQQELENEMQQVDDKDKTEETAEKDTVTQENSEQPEEEKTQETKETKTTSSSKKKSSSKSSASKKNRKSVKSLELELKAQSEIIDDLSAKIKQTEEALQTAQDKYQRLMAEFENMRKRTEKESKRMYDIGAKEVLEKLLPVIDNFERAQMAVTEEQKEDAFVQGIDRIYRQLIEYLTSVNVEPMNAEGKEFDPELHNAVMHIEDDTYNENVVLEELQKGYMYKEEVLRHSMVKVAN